MEIKTFAPVIIPTLCRYEHFKRCIESLDRCTWADKTDVYVGLDYPPAEQYVEGWKKIDEYLKMATFRFNKLEAFRHEKNLGSGGGGNLRFLKSIVKQNKYSCYIETEDDNEFSPCFLDFMNKALEMFKDDPYVTSVAGWIPDKWYGITHTNIFFTHYFSAWGAGEWINKEDAMPTEEYYSDILNNWFKAFKLLGKSLVLFLNLYWGFHLNRRWEDVRRGCYNILEGTYQVRPSVSMVNNWGADGSGVNCRNVKGYEPQQITKQTTYELDNVNTMCTKAIVTQKTEAPKTWWKLFPVRMVKLLLYIYDRLTGKRFQ